MARGGYQKRRIQQMKAKERAARKRARRKRSILTWTSVVVALGVIAGLALTLRGGPDDFLADDKSPTPTNTQCTKAGPETLGKRTFENPPCEIIDKTKTYRATIETSQGDLEIKLFADKAPKTVNNFVFLAKQGFYDGLVFHRVIPDFMIQGGDPQGNGTGGPGYEFGDENTVAFDKPGYLAMANSGPNTNGSQFFITETPIGHLNEQGKCPGQQGCHSIFGEVEKGLDIVKKIARVKRDASDKPEKPVTIEKITIEEA